MSPEAAVSRSWLDWIAALPWHERSDDTLDVSIARDVLEADLKAWLVHHGAEAFADPFSDDHLKVIAKIEAAITAAEAAASTASASAFAHNSGLAGRYSTIEWYQEKNDGFSGEWFITVQAEALIGTLDLRFGASLAADVDLNFRMIGDKSADDMTWLIENSPYELKDNEHDTFSHTFNLPTSTATYMSRYATKSRAAGGACDHLISDQTLALSWPSTTDPNVDGTGGGFYCSVRGYNIDKNVTNSSYNYLATNVGALYPLGVAVIKYDWEYP
jgi:hypothetical protein